ncbi:heterogeneous nuclear ribonucleoprotein R [Canna indica]|uniref:Heterogeneous nuclear ribonucleoprotein R n=1 Tax=Canna indica TaxID=4628 RepID=A0AAQ3KZY1_9LILI|nr:heterogeneous nuclear ribonucleoprotein R [Canna indica]
MEDRLQPEEQIDYDGVKDLLEYFLNDEEPVVKENGHVKCREEFGKEDEERSYGGGDDREEEVDSDGRRGDVSIVEGFNDDGSEGEDEGGEEVKEPFDVKDDDDDEIRKRAELLALPPHGSEIFIGGLPRDASEEDLRELANHFGDIFEVTVIKDKDTKESKGCAFVMFTSSDAAQKAIEGIHEKIFEGRTLRCNFSQAKHRLFVGNVPRSLMEEEVWRILQETGPGVQHIEMFKDPHNQTRNRGFLFVEFYNHACAEYTRQKMIDPNFKIDETNPVVNWANSSTADQVKAIYVKNLPDNVSSGRLKKLFEQNGEVTMVVFPPAKFGQGKQDLVSFISQRGTVH